MSRFPMTILCKSDSKNPTTTFSSVAADDKVETPRTDNINLCILQNILNPPLRFPHPAVKRKVHRPNSGGKDSLSILESIRRHDDEVAKVPVRSDTEADEEYDEEGSFDAARSLI